MTGLRKIRVVYRVQHWHGEFIRNAFDRVKSLVGVGVGVPQLIVNVGCQTD